MRGPLFLSARHRQARDRVAAALAVLDGESDWHHRRLGPTAMNDAYRALDDALADLHQQLEGET